MNKRFVCRSLSTRSNRRRISVIGSGPSGFYIAYHLLKKSEIPLEVNLWEKLPFPFGLSRYGVAPDHPEVKKCEQTFTDCANHFSMNDRIHKFNFMGNIEVGKDIPLEYLVSNQDAVVLSYGCMGDRRLDIPGENDTKGVFSSHEFVNWYNGHPDFSHSPRFTDFDWEKVHNVGIIGHGNVALDITRVLLSNRIDEIWAHTDISRNAIEQLKRAPIRNVKLIARRDFVHSKFTNKELRELWELEKYGIRGTISEKFFDEDMFDGMTLDRVLKRRVEMCQQYLLPFDARKRSYQKCRPPLHETNHWELDYLKSPIAVHADKKTGMIKSLEVENNRLTADNKLVPQGSRVIYDVDLLITSLGYAGEPLQDFKKLGIAFAGSHIANDRGRVLNTEGKTIPNLYASGWIRRGSQGVIATTMQDAFAVADTVLEDLLVNSNAARGPCSLQLPSEKRVVSWNDWLKIDAAEVLRASKSQRPRDKFLRSSEALALLQSDC